MTDDPSRSTRTVVQSLPARPLTREEGDALNGQATESIVVRPESLMLVNGDRVVVALAVFDRAAERLWAVGYSPARSDWEVFGSWTTTEIGHDAFYEALHAWELETYHSVADE